MQLSSGTIPSYLIVGVCTLRNATVKYRLPKGTIRRDGKSYRGFRIVLFERRCWTETSVARSCPLSETFLPHCRGMHFEKCNCQVSSPKGDDTQGREIVPGFRIVLFERRCWTETRTSDSLDICQLYFLIYLKAFRPTVNVYLYKQKQKRYGKFNSKIVKSV